MGRRGRALTRRYGLRTADEFLTPPADVRHAYKKMLIDMHNNPGHNKAHWRHLGARDGIPKPVTDRVLTIAERRGHVEVHEGKLYVTPRGREAAWPVLREP